MCAQVVDIKPLNTQRATSKVLAFVRLTCTGRRQLSVMSRPICRLKVVTGHATALRTSACGSESEDDVDLDSLAYGFMASQA